MIGYQYICPAGSNSCHFRTVEKLRGVSPPSTQYPQSDDFYRDQEMEDDCPPKFQYRFNFTERDLTRHVDFDIRGNDVIVFLHIQKTGGTTFGRHLVRNIRLEQPCDCKPGQKKCTCHRPGKEESWLFSRFSTGWSCGLHADWTELTNCVPVIMDKKEAQRNRRAVRIAGYHRGDGDTGERSSEQAAESQAMVLDVPWAYRVFRLMALGPSEQMALPLLLKAQRMAQGLKMNRFYTTPQRATAACLACLQHHAGFSLANLSTARAVSESNIRLCQGKCNSSTFLCQFSNGQQPGLTDGSAAGNSAPQERFMTAEVVEGIEYLHAWLRPMSGTVLVRMRDRWVTPSCSVAPGGTGSFIKSASGRSAVVPFHF
ncbi:hypothetical protein SKAU_G00253930 [Synaphobranchus kaupii]|uniref:Heparan-sulfate 6-O-sulfotransferase n=1 Tax=Synaphobranchus kaupii TaxID=118154 RepID=A0A9Q1F3D7_SYNKA|nr:hypothetical protein SKAU_G00253930 [Synaphobranchus kaupii]